MSTRKYFGQAYARKAYVGPKSVNLRLEKDEALLLAERVLRGANASKAIDVAVYPTRKKAKGYQITVTAGS